MKWVQHALPQDVGGAQPAGQCQDENASITGHSGRAMAGSSVTGDDVPPHIQ
jgi:hypothetical protein